MTKILLGCATNRIIFHWQASLGLNYQIKLAKSLDSILEKWKNDRHYPLVVIDYGLLRENYEESLSRLQLSISESKVLLIGENCDREIQLKAFRRGFQGYMESHLSRELLRKGIERLLNGEMWVERSMVKSLFQSLREQNSAQDEFLIPNRLNMLTPREIEIAGMICRGASNKKIANHLNITERTVKAHLSSIFRKLNVTDRLQLAVLIKDGNSELQVETTLDD